VKRTQVNHGITALLCISFFSFFSLKSKWPTTQELVAHIKGALESPKSLTSEDEAGESDTSQSQLEKALVARMLLDCAERKADDAQKQELKELREQLDEAVYTSLVDCTPNRGRRMQRPHQRPTQQAVHASQEPQQQIISHQEVVRDPSFRNALVSDKLTVGSLDAKQTVIDNLVVRNMLTVPNGIVTQADSEHLNSLWVDNAIKGGNLDIAGQTIVRGSLYLSPTAQTLTNISPSLNDGVTVGVLIGGILSAQKLTAYVGAGTGYLKMPTSQGDALQYTTWPAVTAPLQPSADNFVYINQQAKAVVSTIPLSDERFIFIGKVRTSATDALFVQRINQQAKHTANKLVQVVEGALGSLYVSGLAVGQAGTAGLQISAGQYYWGTHQFNPNGGSSISWLAFCGTTNTFVAQQSALDYQQYDVNGTLTPIPAGMYARHLLLVAGDGDTERYLLVYSQKWYEDVAHAEVGDVPITPASWTGNILQLASIIVKNDATAPLVKILDEKPRHGVVVNSVSGTEHHGNLLDLGLDQHKQYLLVNGTRAMTGPLDMGNQSIVNVHDVNGVVLADRAKIDALAARIETLSVATSKHDASLRDSETQQAIPIPAFGMTGMNVHTAQRVYEGAVYYLLRDVTFKKIVFRTTETVAPAALSLGIYQTATGSSGVGTLIASITSFAPIPGGAATQVVACKEGVVTLRAGIIYVLFGRATAAGALTLRTYSCPDIDLITNETAYGYPLSFTTTLPSATPLPTTFNPAQALAAHGSHAAAILRFVG
jgi:hypothetical protein